MILYSLCWPFVIDCVSPSTFQLFPKVRRTMMSFHIRSIDTLVKFSYTRLLSITHPAFSLATQHCVFMMANVWEK